MSQYRVRFIPGDGVASLRRFTWTLSMLRLRGDYMTYRGDCIQLVKDRAAAARYFWVYGLGMGFESLSEAMSAVRGARGDDR